MCGIAGIIRMDGRPVLEGEISAMCGAMTHRGPDDEGVYLGEGAGLGMRRLSIIDIENGQQPVSNEDGSIWVVFNGEIYNHRELRGLLTRRGHEVVTADCVASARAAVYETRAPFDLLLSDIELPDGDGMNLMRELSARGRIPGIALSGFGAEDDRRLTREAGFAEHLTKPVDMGSLDAAIKRAIQRVRAEQPDGARQAPCLVGTV